MFVFLALASSEGRRADGKEAWLSLAPEVMKEIASADTPTFEAVRIRSSSILI